MKPYEKPMVQFVSSQISERIASNCFGSAASDDSFRFEVIYPYTVGNPGHVVPIPVTISENGSPEAWGNCADTYNTAVNDAVNAALKNSSLEAVPNSRVFKNKIENTSTQAEFSYQNTGTPFWHFFNFSNNNNNS